MNIRFANPNIILNLEEHDRYYIEPFNNDESDIIDNIEDLFDFLYHIKEKTVDHVAKFIIDSMWTKSKESIYELASIIIQVIQNNILLHNDIIELLFKLDQNNTNNLNLLLQYTINRLLFIYKKNISEKEGSNLVYPFIFKLYKEGLIKNDEKLFNHEFNIENSFFILWFLPELFSKNEHFNKAHIDDNIIYSHNVKKIEEYKKMRDNDENPNQIAIALRNDDIDSFQSYVSNDIDILLKKTIKQNMFEPFLSKNEKYLNYAAAYGSVKCFKYMLLNNEKIDEVTFKYAIIGGNNEIIRIIDNEKDLNIRSILEALKESIKRHQNDHFDWIFENKFKLINQKNYLATLIECSFTNCNIHSLVQIFDKGIHSSILPITIAAEKGFYSFLVFLNNYINNNIFCIKDIESIINTGNILLFKLIENSMTEDNYADSIKFAIEYNHVDILEYIIKTIYNHNFKFHSKNSFELLKFYIKSVSNPFENNLINILIEICQLNVISFAEFIAQTFELRNSQFYQKIADSIYKFNSNNDFTSLSFHVLKLELKDIFVYFIEKKYKINYEDLAEMIIESDFFDDGIFSLIIKNINYESKKRFVSYLNQFKNKKIELDSQLIYAVKANCFSMVETILKDNVKPSYINMISKYGTALTISVEKENLQILEKLLSIPGIDPNIYITNFKTPLILSAFKYNINIFETILKFNGNEIDKLKWQLEKIVKFIISDNNSNNFETKIKMLEIIINLNCIDLNLRVQNNTLLTFVCQNNLIEIFKILLQNDSIDINLNIPKTGDTPLIISIQNYNHEITKMLINHPKIDINIKNYRLKTALIYAAKLNQNDIIDLLSKSAKHDLTADSISLSNLTILKNYVYKKCTSIDIYNYKMLKEHFPIKINPINLRKFNFIIDFQNIFSKNLNEPIISPEFFTNSICARYIIDFTNETFLFNITDFAGSGSYIALKVTFLNQNKELSKSIKISMLYCESNMNSIKKLPVSKEDFLNPEKGYLFDDNTVKIRVEFESCQEKSFLYPIVTNYNSQNLGGFRFLIPISLFNENSENKLIEFPQVKFKNCFIIYPFISYSYDDDGNKIRIKTHFKLDFLSRESFHSVFIYENTNSSKSFCSVFVNINSKLIQMPDLLIKKPFDKNEFIFITEESKKVLHLNLYFGNSNQLMTNLPLMLNNKQVNLSNLNFHNSEI